MMMAESELQSQSDVELRSLLADARSERDRRWTRTSERSARTWRLNVQ